MTQGKPCLFTRLEADQSLHIGDLVRDVGAEHDLSARGNIFAFLQPGKKRILLERIRPVSILEQFMPELTVVKMIVIRGYHHVRVLVQCDAKQVWREGPLTRLVSASLASLARLGSW